MKCSLTSFLTDFAVIGIFRLIRPENMAGVDVRSEIGEVFPNCKYCTCLAFCAIVPHLLPAPVRDIESRPRAQLKFVQFRATQILTKLCSAAGDIYLTKLEILI